MCREGGPRPPGHSQPSRIGDGVDTRAGNGDRDQEGGAGSGAEDVGFRFGHAEKPVEHPRGVDLCR